MGDSIALGRVIAGFLKITDVILGYFVTVSYTAGSATNFMNAYDCNVGAYSATLTNCGHFLCNQMALLIVNLIALGGNVLPALGVS